MDYDKDIDEITYEEYEFVPLAPMDHTSIPEEMKEFMSMCCMMGMMPMSNLMNPMQRILGVNGIINEKDAITINEENKSKSIRIQEMDDSNHKIKQRFNPNIEGDYKNYNYGKIDNIVDLIEENNHELFKFLDRNHIPYDRARKFIKRIIRLTLMYCD